MKKIFLALITMFLSLSSSARINDLHLIGEGQLTWLMFEVYHAELYAANTPFQAGSYPLALQLTYHRNISKDDLVEVTRDEWQRLNIEGADPWLQQLSTLWPDIKAGDKLVFRADNKNKGSFYFNDHHIGDIDDTNFSESFLAIWLSPDSKAKKLREKLIGNSHV